MIAVLLVAAIAVCAALVQVGPLSLIATDAVAAPLLPVAVIAGWGVARRAEETWLALLLAPVVYGVASHDRVGLFVLALWPTAALALLARGLDRDPAGRSARRLAGAAAAAAAGAACYVALMTLGGGTGAAALAAHPRALAVAIAITALAGAGVALGAWPTRPRPRGLFE